MAASSLHGAMKLVSRFWKDALLTHPVNLILLGRFPIFLGNLFEKTFARRVILQVATHILPRGRSYGKLCLDYLAFLLGRTSRHSENRLWLILEQSGNLIWLLCAFFSPLIFELSIHSLQQLFATSKLPLTRILFLLFNRRVTLLYQPDFLFRYSFNSTLYLHIGDEETYVIYHRQRFRIRWV